MSAPVKALPPPDDSRGPIYDGDLAAAILGTAMNEPALAGKLVERFGAEPAAFAKPPLDEIYRAVRDCVEADEEPNALNVLKRVGWHHAAYINDMARGNPLIAASFESLCDSLAKGIRPIAHRRLPLTAKMPPSEPFPVAALGDVLGGAVEAMRETIQAPDSLCANSVLATASLVVQPYADVETVDGRVFPCSSFVLTVGDSGERKSAVDSAALAPILAFQRELSMVYKREFAAHEINRAAFDKSKLDALKARGIEAKRTALEALGDSPEPPLLPFVTTNDFTLEGVQKLLLISRPSIGIFSDEAGTIAGGHSMNRDNLLKTVAGLSTLWDGRDTARARSGDGAALLSGKRVSLHWMMQPPVAELILGNELLTDQGFLNRCLRAWPESTAGTRTFNPLKLADDPRMQRYHLRMLEILRMPLPLRAGTRNELEPRRIPLCAAAISTWVDFSNYVEGRLGNGGALALIRGLAVRAAEYAQRIATVLALVDNPHAVEVSLTHLQSGITICEFYLAEALRIKRRGEIAKDMALAERLRKWWEDRAAGTATSSEVYQYGPNAVRPAETAKRIIGILVDRGYLIETEPNTWALTT